MVPLGITIEGVKLAKGGVLPLIAPREVEILKMDLIELARLKRILETVDSALINIFFVFIPSSPNLIEVA
jgi:hypothetical protein